MTFVTNQLNSMVMPMVFLDYLCLTVSCHTLMTQPASSTSARFRPYLLQPQTYARSLGQTNYLVKSTLLFKVAGQLNSPRNFNPFNVGKMKSDFNQVVCCGEFEL